MEISEIEKELQDRLKAGLIYMNALDRDNMYDINYLHNGLDIVMMSEEVETVVSKMVKEDELEKPLADMFYQHCTIVSFLFYVLEVLRMSESLNIVPPYGLFDLARTTAMR